MALRWRPTEQTPRFAFLLAAMFSEILLAPIIVASPFGLVGARVVTALMLVAALAAIGTRRLSIALFTLAAVTHVLALLRPQPTAVLVATVLQIVFLAYVCGQVIARVLRERNVTYDTLAGAACGYLLLGLVWGELFVLNQLLQPGAFEIPAGFAVGQPGDSRAALIYFSFVTLTTLGYGYVHPNNPGAGGLAVSEAIVGQFYMAVMVARLVGLNLADRGR